MQSVVLLMGAPFRNGILSISHFLFFSKIFRIPFCNRLFIIYLYMHVCLCMYFDSLLFLVVIVAFRWLLLWVICTSVKKKGMWRDWKENVSFRIIVQKRDFKTNPDPSFDSSCKSSLFPLHYPHLHIIVFSMIPKNTCMHLYVRAIALRN